MSAHVAEIYADIDVDAAFNWFLAFRTGLVLGIGAAVPPGPVNLEIARRTVGGGFVAGASVGLGAVTVDVGFALLLWVGVLGLLQAVPGIRVPVTLAGVGVLAYLGLAAMADFRRRLGLTPPTLAAPTNAAELSPTVAELPLDSVAPSAPTLRRASASGYLTGVVLCATSPYQAAWWLMGVPAVLDNGTRAGAARQAGAAVCAGVVVATLLWVAFFTTVLTRLRTLDRRRRWLPAAMDLIGGVVLLSFAGLTAWKLVAQLL